MTTITSKISNIDANRRHSDLWRVEQGSSCYGVVVRRGAAGFYFVPDQKSPECINSITEFTARDLQEIAELMTLVKEEEDRRDDMRIVARRNEEALQWNIYLDSCWIGLTTEIQGSWHAFGYPGGKGELRFLDKSYKSRSDATDAVIGAYWKNRVDSPA